jgi:TolB protein
VFATRIAYVLKQGNTYELQIADADGQNPQVALRSREPVISPAWSPDGSRLAYVSFESGKPVVYVHQLATSKRFPVANFKGNNSAPAWSPDGSQLAVVLTRDGLSQIYTVSAADGSNLRRITRSPLIDTEPVFSPDGRSIYFTSDRSGSPQIYQAGLDGGEPRRITFNGGYNISPRISPDGKTLLTVTRRDGAYRIVSLNLTNNTESFLTAGRDDQSPSFAPNGMQVLYASVQGGRSVLAGVSSDGRVRQTLSILNGEIREPTWGPFSK